MPFRPLDPLRDPVFGDDLTKSQVPVEDQQGLGVDHGLAAVSRQNFTVAKPFQINRKPDGAVGRMSAHVGENEVPRNRRRLIRPTARSLEYTLEKRLQAGGGNDDRHVARSYVAPGLKRRDRPRPVSRFGLRAASGPRMTT